MLITWKRMTGLRSFRRKKEATILVEAIRAARRSGFRIVHFSIQTDHLHFLIEADSRKELASGMRGLGCRLARGLNRSWRRSGKVFAERFHERVLKSLKQMHNALRYVLNNHRKHGHRAGANRPDTYSSGAYFDGWADYPRRFDPADENSYVSPPGWKLRVGWKRSNPPIALGFTPG